MQAFLIWRFSLARPWFSVPIERTVDWEQVKRCLHRLHRDSRIFLGRALLIGGAACWFYRIQLRNAGDLDFKTPELSVPTEKKWLSKDIDFTGLFSEDALELLPHRVVSDSTGRKHIEIEGVRLGFAQAGLTIDPGEALQQAQLARFQYQGETIEFLVVDPLTLYREKQALTMRRNQDSDHLHLSLLREYLCWRIVTEAETFLSSRETLPVNESRRILGFFAQIHNRAPEILADPRIGGRLSGLLRPADATSALVSAQLKLNGSR